MTDDILYRRIEHGKRVRYEPYVAPPQRLNDEMTEGEIITAVATLAVMTIKGYSDMIPEKKFVGRRVNAVRAAVLSMFTDTGAKIDNATTVHVCRVWNESMLKLSGDTETRFNYDV